MCRFVLQICPFAIATIIFFLHRPVAAKMKVMQVVEGGGPPQWTAMEESGGGPFPFWDPLLAEVIDISITMKLINHTKISFNQNYI